MNVIMISTGNRNKILAQSILSLLTNASDWSKHTLTIVMDNPRKHEQEFPEVGPHFRENGRYATVISPNEQLGASRARNVGASSIPKYIRQSHVCFVDDDIYACPKWDEKLEAIANNAPNSLISGSAHPYNHTELFRTQYVIETTVLSSVHMLMSWKLFDQIGWWTEPGGAGGSEDVDYSNRAVQNGCSLLVTSPHCIIHTGIHSSSGKPIVGAEMVMERNRELERLYEISGRVIYS